MFLMYVDESGSIADASQKHFVLAGVAVFERMTHWIEGPLDEIAGRFAPDANSIELHGSPMYGGRGDWRSHPKADRVQALKDILNAGVINTYRNRTRLFAAVVEKQALPGRDVIEFAFECLVSRFDNFLKRSHHRGDTQRGLMLFDKSATELRLQSLAREFKLHGHGGGRTQNFAEVPVFLDSRSSRLIQLADVVSWALYRHFEHGDSTYFEVVKNCFDNEGGVTHGLHVLQVMASAASAPADAVSPAP